MKPGREGVAADESLVDIVEDQPSQPLAPEGVSDDEYEHFPVRKEKIRRVHSPTHGDHPAPSRDGQRTQKRPVTDCQGTDEVVDSVRDDGKASATEATDDDWLRSRTSRLLDLVDPDELTAGAMPSPEDEPLARDTEENGETAHSSDDVTYDVAEGETRTPGVSQDEAADAISKTSRLFIRNLPYSATEDDVRDTFEKFGALQEVCDHLDKPIVPRPSPIRRYPRADKAL